MSRIVVIGAGVAGLATAGLLAREGHEVTILERNSRVGGRAGTIERDGFRFDSGPSWYLMPEVFDHFFAMMGTTTEEQLDLTLLDPGYRVFRAPETSDEAVSAVTVPAGRAAVAEFFESLEPGSGPALDAYLDSAHEASTMAEKHFLYNPFTRVRTLAAPEVLRALPRLFSLLGSRLQSFAAKRFRHPVIRQILGYPAVFLGTDPRSAPAMYHLMSALDLDQGVSYPQGGFWRVVERIEALARESGVRIVTDAEVTGIRTANTAAGTDRHRRRVDRRSRHPPARATPTSSSRPPTCTTPRRRLLPPSLRTYPESWWRHRTSGPGGILVMLGVRGALPELPHHSLFFTEDWDANFDAIFGDAPHRSRRPPPPTSASRVRPIRTSRRPTTRTCSC